MILSIATSYIMEADSYTTILVAIYSFSIVLNSFSVIRNYFTSIVQNEYVVKAEISRCLLSMAIKVVLLLLHLPLIWFIVSYMVDFAFLASGYVMAYHAKIGKLYNWR